MLQKIHSIQAVGDAPDIRRRGSGSQRVRDEAIESVIRFGSREYDIIKQLSNDRILKNSRFGHLINLQRLINDYSLKMNMVSRISEALTTTIRKFQQQ